MIVTLEMYNSRESFALMKLLSSLKSGSDKAETGLKEKQGEMRVTKLTSERLMLNLKANLERP